MKTTKLEVFHLFGKSSESRMSDELIYKIMDNVTFKKVENSILREIEDYERILLRFPENASVFSSAVERNKKLLVELKDHFEWIEKD